MKEHELRISNSYGDAIIMPDKNIEFNFSFSDTCYRWSLEQLHEAFTEYYDKHFDHDNALTAKIDLEKEDPEAFEFEKKHQNALKNL